jgi:AAA+ ATPase superfamily predicted ATPase
MTKKPKLLGRETEIRKLNKLLEKGNPDFLAVYGRRRVGKTFLIRQHLKSNIVFDYTGKKEGSLKEQLQNFFEEYLKRTKGKAEKKVPKTWQDAFMYLANYLVKLPKGPYKHVVFIDEMPWLDNPKSNFVSSLEYFWNQHVSNMDNILLIACGSASSWIKKNLINARGGLYNRVTQRIKLQPFNLHETKLFLESLGVKLTNYQIIEIYMAMGGIPFYLKEVEKGKSATQLINSICFSPSGLLFDEYSQLYHSLFRNAEMHIKVIETLAKKPQGMARMDIATASKLSEASLSRTLEELVECDFVSFYEPLINKKKTSIYKLTDLYSLFYLKFIKNNKKKGDGVWEQLSKESTYKAWSGYAFENICMQHINQVKKALGINGIHSTTSSWLFRGNDALPGCQIDMIIDRADKSINLCEAKFTNENFAITKKYAEELRMKKSVFKQATQTKKSTFTTVLTTFPLLKNEYYLEEVDYEITMDKLFEAD